MLYVMLGISLVANIGFILYLKVVLQKLYFVSENISTLLSMVLQYGSHLGIISESEMYYGDESLQALQDHTKMILEEIEEYKEIYSLFDSDIDIEAEQSEQESPDA